MVGVAGQLGVDAPEAAVPAWLSQSDDVSILRRPTAGLTVAVTENVIKYAPRRLVTPEKPSRDISDRNIFYGKIEAYRSFVYRNA